MNWIKENKFLFGFLVVVGIGVAAGGFFVLGAKGRYGEAVEEYERRAAELGRLQRLPTYPNQKNLNRLAEQKDQVNAEVGALASALGAQQVPLEEITPEAFQDRLKAVVTAMRAKATGSNPPTKLPEKFFIGFERYETAPPAREAASALGRELKAVDWLINTLLDNRVVEIRSLRRDDLPEEKGRIRNNAGKRPAATPVPPTAKGAPAKAGGKGPAAPAKDDVQHQVERHRIDLVFVSEQSRFRQIVNQISGNKSQFFIIRTLAVRNEKQTAPARAVATADGGAAAAAPPPPAGEPSAGGAATAPTTIAGYIVGEEKVEVTLAVEFVEFSEETIK